MFNKNLNEAPFNKRVIFLFDDYTIHSGIKIEAKYVQYPGTKNEIYGTQIQYIPIGITCIEDDPYFISDPIGWMNHEDFL